MTGRGLVFPPDPDAVEAALDEMVAGRAFDVTWIFQLAPEQVLRTRAKMKLALSRYGRIPIEHWEKRDLGEMRQYFDLLVELLEKEGATTEDR